MGVQIKEQWSRNVSIHPNKTSLWS